MDRYEDGPAEERADHRAMIRYVLRVLKQYAPVITLIVLAVAVGYVLLAAAYLLRAPSEKNVTLGFRLDFPGADKGKYPNDLDFSPTEIVDASILKKVFEQNALQRYMPLSTFIRSVVVLESNMAGEQLAREYAARLADPKLSAVDRERIEREYMLRRASLSKNEYSLVLTVHERLRQLPPTTSAKILYDILREWADFAAATRQVQLHRVPVVGDQTLTRQASSTGELLDRLLAIRDTTSELRRNVMALRQLPGSEMLRAPRSGASLNEVELEIEQAERTIGYLLSQLASSTATNRTRGQALLESQLQQHRRALDIAEERMRLFRAALEAYTQRQVGDDIGKVPVTTEAPGPAMGTPAVPVLSESFLDRILSMAQDTSEREYRQSLVDDMRDAGLDALPLRSAVAFEEQLLEAMRKPPTVSDPAVAARTETEYRAVVERLRTIARDLTDLRALLSRSLNASGQMYTVTSPPDTVVEKSASVSKLALGGFLVIVVTFVLAIVGSFIHAIVRSAAAEGRAGEAAVS